MMTIHCDIIIIIIASHSLLAPPRWCFGCRNDHIWIRAWRWSSSETQPTDQLQRGPHTSLQHPRGLKEVQNFSRVVVKVESIHGGHKLPQTESVLIKHVKKLNSTADFMLTAFTLQLHNKCVEEICL